MSDALGFTEIMSCPRRQSSSNSWNSSIVSAERSRGIPTTAMLFWAKNFSMTAMDTFGCAMSHLQDIFLFLDEDWDGICDREHSSSGTPHAPRRVGKGRVAAYIATLHL